MAELREKIILWYKIRRKKRLLKRKIERKKYRLGLE